MLDGLNDTIRLPYAVLYQDVVRK